MDKILRNSIIVALFSFLIISFWFVYEYSKNIQGQRVITVIGEGKEIVIPNIAEISIGIIAEGENLKTIQEESNKKMNKIIEFVKSEGIDQKDIKTKNYSIYPKYDYNVSPYRIIGYSLNQNLIVKVRDLSKIDDILKNVVKYGANNISGLNFTVDDLEVYLEKAKEKAILDAKEKAEKIAKTAGLKLGRIISISDPLEPKMGLTPWYSEAGRGGGDIVGSSIEITPKIEPGSQEIKAQVSIIFEIK